MPFYPPNVAGWDATRWLNTGTWQARFNLTADMIGEQRALDPSKDKVRPNPKALTRRALAFWGSPQVSSGTLRALHAYAQAAAVDSATADWERQQYPALTENALRALVVASPAYQTC
jgi:hypothetical protein